MELETKDPVVEVDLDNLTITTTKGQVLPITNLFDFEGDELDLENFDAEDVVSVVAGPDANGQWMASEVGEKESVTEH